MIVGVDESDNEFKTAALTGGEKTHKLTISEMPSHKHNENLNTVYTPNGAYSQVLYYSDASTAVSTDAAGGDQSHNNLQPYITAYRWVRIA